jgi:type III secretion protein V
MNGAPRNHMARLLRGLANHQDLVLVMLVVAVIMLMLFPLPYWAMDALIAFNIGLSVLVLMVAIYVPEALGLSTFPSLLLFTTLLRLGLNIASTKLILLHAHAGQVIETFGRLVVGGNYVVGGVVFLIITVVQFIVIAKGAERVAEVGARFTLDAMPGKQMSIDADLRAGMIGAEEARQRRRHLERESQLNGGMDGAMKFVKGDAIASLIISLVSIVAGIAIGTMMMGMSVGEAAARYAILTVGDGMVSQIPSLFVSIAAGVLITRVAGNEQQVSNLGRDIGGQLVAQPKALMITGGILLACALLPGFPRVQFLLLALATGGAGAYLTLSLKGRQRLQMATIQTYRRDGSREVPPMIEQRPPPGSMPLMMRVSPALAARLRAPAVEEALTPMRLSLQEEIGLPFPGLRVVVHPPLEDLALQMMVHGVPLRVSMASPDALAEEGLASPEHLMAREVEAAVKGHAISFMGIQEAKVLLARAEADYPDVVAEVNKSLPLQRIAEVFRRLIEEGLSIRDLRGILESLIQWGPKEKDVVMLTEHARIALNRQISHRFGNEQGEIEAVLLAPRIEDAMRQAIQDAGGAGYVPAIDPDETQRLCEQISEIAAKATLGTAVLVTHFDIRRYMKKLLEPHLPQLTVLSFQEINLQAKLLPLGQVEG